MAITRLMTIDELERMEPDEDQYELVRGELRRMAPAGGEASTIAVEIAAHLWTYVKPRQLGRIFGADGGFLLARNPDTVLVPDVAFVRSNRLPPAEELRGILRLPPDLAVEVVSPTDRLRDVAAKVQIYLDAGVPLVWVVEPRSQQVTVYPIEGERQILLGGQVLDGGDVLSGFRLPIDDIFS